MSFEKYLISSNATFENAIAHIDRTGTQIVFVIDESLRLIGSVSDGDFRRSILKHCPLNSPITQIMNRNPITADIHESRADVILKMRKNKIRHIPCIDSERRVKKVELFESILDQKSLSIPNTAVIMAGGLGKRLAPLTEDCPKPLLKVGGQPVLETILNNLIEHGFRHVYISVNYKAEMIQDYFKDGKKWGIKIEYIQEANQMGTAGSLGLLPPSLNHPVLITNGDILTKINFTSLLDFHAQENAQGTMCVREYEFKVPYGVVQIDKKRITKIEEKPIHKFFVNAGMYILNPSVFQLLEPETPLDMPKFFETLIAKQMKTICFPVHEYWLDIGQMADFERANGEFNRFFKGE